MAELLENKSKSALSGWPMIIGWLAMIIFACHASTRMVAAGDTWVAMACGRHFLNHGVDTVEPFSANSHKAGPTQEEVDNWPKAAKWIVDKVGLETVRYWHPTGWVNQNWLTHVIFYWVTHESPFADAETRSFNTLVYWKFAIYILAVICVYYVARLLGVNPALAAVFACFAMFTGRSFFDIRPAGFSNLLTAAFLLILVLTTYRNILYIWLIVPLSVFWCNVHGGYIYVFIMLIPFIGFHFLASLPRRWTAILYNIAAWPFFLYVVFSLESKKYAPQELSWIYFQFLLLFVALLVLNFVLIFLNNKLVSIGWKGVWHTVIAGAVTFLAVIIFNPFHLTNLTHTFIISASKHAKAWRTVNEWHPAFEWRNPVGDERAFLVMYIMAWVALAIWAVVLISTWRFAARNQKPKDLKASEYQWPKIDLALMVIAAMTIYMAIRSRRFIPIAAFAACPILAMLIDQTIRAISAVRNFLKQKRLYVSPMHRYVQWFFTTAGIGLVLSLGTWWGLKFKRIYLDPWPTDTKLTSVFQRMTASSLKPFYALEFIRDNNLEGKMFNYWTEGGFIAYGQNPDPNTGKTPLQLFMDGRAQAAYQRKDYDTWARIMTAGPDVYSARARKTAIPYGKAGKWIGQRLREHNVWVVLMPREQFSKPFTRGLDQNRNWPIVFLNEKQKVFVDITTPQGKKLYDGMFDGTTKYPDVFSRNVTLANNLRRFSKEKSDRKRAFELAMEAFRLNPSLPAMNEIMFATKVPELSPSVYNFCMNYFDEFEKNKDDWSKEPGYHNRMIPALIAGDYLGKIASRRKDAKLAKFYAAKNQENKNEQRRIIQGKRW